MTGGATSVRCPHPHSARDSCAARKSGRRNTGGVLAAMCRRARAGAEPEPEPQPQPQQVPDSHGGRHVQRPREIL
jgi:hypothetical protein